MGRGLTPLHVTHLYLKLGSLIMKMTIQRLDWFLVLPAALAGTMIAEIDPPRESFIAVSQWEQAAIVVPVTLLMSVLIAIGSAIDRRCSEEYLFQLMSNAALVGVATSMLIHLLWIIGIKAFNLPDMAAENMVGITTLSWIAAYYWFRLKGISP